MNNDLSIIMPTRNECGVLESTLSRLSQAQVREIIVVDGHSNDDTVAIARSFGARIIVAKPGRGSQLKAGANAASGTMLLFLHADTQLPSDFEHDVTDILCQPGVAGGAFQLRINSPKWTFRLIEKMVAYRSRYLQLPYGDQAIFVFSSTYHKLGGFPDIPVMEDFVFTRRLRKHGLIRLASSSVLTSSRRWDDEGILRATLRNQALIAGYCLGVSPQKLARWRNGAEQPDAVTTAT